MQLVSAGAVCASFLLQGGLAESWGCGEVTGPPRPWLSPCHLLLFILSEKNLGLWAFSQRRCAVPGMSRQGRPWTLRLGCLT